MGSGVRARWAAACISSCFTARVRFGARVRRCAKISLGRTTTPTRTQRLVSGGAGGARRDAPDLPERSGARRAQRLAPGAGEASQSARGRCGRIGQAAALTKQSPIAPHVGADELGALDHVQANAAEAKHDDIRARLDLRGVRHGANAGGDTAPDISNFIEGRVIAHLRQRYFGKHGEVRERGTSHNARQSCPCTKSARCRPASGLCLAWRGSRPASNFAGAGPTPSYAKIPPKGDKQMRMSEQTSPLGNGFVFVPDDAPWLDEYLHEMVMFPNGRYDG